MTQVLRFRLFVMIAFLVMFAVAAPAFAQTSTHDYDRLQPADKSVPIHLQRSYCKQPESHDVAPSW